MASWSAEICWMGSGPAGPAPEPGSAWSQATRPSVDAARAAVMKKRGENTFIGVRLFGRWLRAVAGRRCRAAPGAGTRARRARARPPLGDPAVSVRADAGPGWGRSRCRRDSPTGSGAPEVARGASSPDLRSRVGSRLSSVADAFASTRWWLRAIFPDFSGSSRGRQRPPGQGSKSPVGVFLCLWGGGAYGEALVSGTGEGVGATSTPGSAAPGSAAPWATSTRRTSVRSGP